MAVAATLTVDLARKVVCTVLINPRSKFVASASRFFLPPPGPARVPALPRRARSDSDRSDGELGAEPWSRTRGRNRRFTPRNRLERSGQLLYLSTKGGIKTRLSHPGTPATKDEFAISPCGFRPCRAVLYSHSTVVLPASARATCPVLASCHVTCP